MTSVEGTELMVQWKGDLSSVLQCQQLRCWGLRESKVNARGNGWDNHPLLSGFLPKTGGEPDRTF